MLHYMPKERNVSQPIFVLALALTVVVSPKATITKSNEWKKYWRVILRLQNDIQLYSTMLLSIFLHFTPLSPKNCTKKYMYVQYCKFFLKGNAIFTLLLLPSFNHRFPKLFPQCKSKRHSNGVSYLPVLLKSSQQLVTLYFQNSQRLTSCTICEGSVLIDLKIYESGNPCALAHSLTEIIRFCWFHMFN